ncbi:hypothetical protein FT641_18295 [Bacillus paranthracis]|uniref:hypothetical protein n=1 Tax=Bacillus paranthracis TaxID=2026186 RepID=UPI00187A4AE7|nr:hypothetical protein [Bacillus paranthracis]MBE7114486.1 hypothetical protein [Bacillus paranthracis]MBE7154640.1 hypothetical protein [Bacillus paranthracis]
MGNLPLFMSLGVAAMGLFGIIGIWGIAVCSGLVRDNVKASIIATAVLLAITVPGSLYSYYGLDSADKELKAKVAAKMDELEKEENKMYVLLERELHVGKDKMIVEDMDGYKKVTSSSGIYKVKFKYDGKGKIQEIENADKIMD